MRTARLSVDTSGRRVVEITDQVVSFARDAGGDGLLNVFVPHATAGVALIETGAGTEEDLIGTVERLLPREDRYRHRHGSPGHGADHVLPALVAPSIVLPVSGGEVVLGPWQRVVIVDPNRENNDRTVVLSLLEG
ncbi:MAG: YjbQ family protein [Actinomycetota bacterium]